MNWLRSFRWRILLGAFFWTLGLIPVGHLVFMAIHGHRTGLIMLPVGSGTSFLFAGFCLVAGILLVRAGLSPFRRLRDNSRVSVTAPAGASKEPIPSRCSRW